MIISVGLPIFMTFILKILLICEQLFPTAAIRNIWGQKRKINKLSMITQDELSYVNNFSLLLLYKTYDDKKGELVF